MSGPAHRGKSVSNAQFARLYADRTLTCAQIGEVLGITAQAVRFRAKSRGLPLRGQGKVLARVITRHDEAEFASMYLSGVFTHEIAQHYHVTRCTVRKTAQRLNLPKRSRGHRHVGIPLAAWREAQIGRKMEALAAATRAALAEHHKRMGVAA